MPMLEETVPAIHLPRKVSSPMPDLLYGYHWGNAFSEQEIQPRAMDRPGRANAGGLLYPFLLVEFKGDDGSLKAATNQCLGGAASCIHISNVLNHELDRRSSTTRVDGAVFSIAMNGYHARIHLSWRENDTYCMQMIETFDLQRAAHMLEFRKYVFNILDWGKGERLDSYRTALDALLEAERLALSKVAKSRPPPSST